MPAPTSQRSKSNEEASSRRLPTWLALACILVAGIASYANALHGPLLFDDLSAIERNPTIRDLGDLAAVLHPPVQSPLGGRPLVNLTFAANYASGGLAVEGYHLVNIAWHLLAAVALFGVLRRTCARTSIAGLPSGALDTAALAATLFWTVHPLNTESVDYISQRTELMLGFFYLSAVYAAIRAVDRPGLRWTGVTAIAAVLAGACKESAVTLPFVLVLWDRLFAPGSRWKERWKVYAAGAASWVMFALLAGQTSATRSLTLTAHASRWTYLLNQAEVIPQYLRRALWPSDLIFDYGTMPPIALGDVLPGLLLLLALFALTLFLVIRRPHIGFWAAWFWITLAPASSVVPIVTEVGAERRMYLPLVGVICVLTLAGASLLHRVLTSERQRRLAGWGICGALVLALSAATVARNADYRSGLRMWETVVERRPAPRAHEHLSEFLRDAGRQDESIAHLRLAVDGDPVARHALAAALLERGDVNEALDQFRTFIQNKPHDSTIGLARREYAAGLRRNGNLPEAIEQLHAAAIAEPGEVRNYIELADALRAAGRADEAITVYQNAQRLQPGNIVVLTNLGVLLAERGRGAEAMRPLRAALDIDPSQPAPRLQIVQLLLLDGRFTDAEAEARTLLSTMPSNAEAHNLLGVALASQGRLESAHAAFARALQLRPGYVDAQQNLARIESMPRSSRQR